MTLVESIILGLVQGLTEFVPISSSAHLALAHHLLGVEPTLFFDIFLHLATLLVTFYVFKDRCLALIKAIPQLPMFFSLYAKNRFQAKHTYPQAYLFFLLMITTLLTALLGFALKHQTEDSFASLPRVGVELLITGVVLFSVHVLHKPGTKTIPKLTLLDSIWMGLAQGISVLPGISRSGACLSTGLATGWERKMLGDYVFVMSIPAILGAFLLSAKDVDVSVVPWRTVSVGFLASAISGFVSLKILLRWIEQGKLVGFAYYCAALGCLLVLTKFIL